MKKIIILIVSFFFSGMWLMAQYSGGNGSGAFTGSLTARHLTNWFQTNGNWSTPGNWIDGVVPSSFEEANISAEATLDGDYTYPVINIASGGILNIPEGKTLTITDDIQNGNGNTGLLLENGSSLIHPNANVQGTMQREVSNADWTSGFNGWHLLSSPVENQLLSNGGFTDPEYDFYAWQESTNLWLNQKDINNGITSFIPGKGYLVSYDDGGIKTFTGEFNVNDIMYTDLSLTGNSYYGGYHLLGNPFTSALKWNDVNWSLSNVSGVASIWNKTAQNYLSLANSGDIIPANQGFFIQVNDASNNITIPALSRTHSQTAFYKEIPADYLKLKVTNTLNGTFDETIVRSKTDATSAYDPAYDGHKLEGNQVAPLLYTVLQNDEHAAVNTFASSDVPASIEMGFKPGLSTTFTLNVEDYTFNRQIVLEDRLTGNTRILAPDFSYTFNGMPGDAENRFLLHFSPLAIPEETGLNNMLIYSIGKNIYINSPVKGDVVIKIISAAGQIVYSGLNSTKDILIFDAGNIARGIYIVTVAINGYIHAEKVIL